MLRLAAVMQGAIVPALALLPAKMCSREAKVMLLAIGLQESGFTTHVQMLANGKRGPAHGYLQFEIGGVRGVMNHPQSRLWLVDLCRERACAFTPEAIWAQIETDDVLAMGLGRLLLWTDPKPLPAVDQPQEAWALYLRCWRPGEPRPESWPAHHAAAVAEVMS
jgi:hypothetical protein